jgi:hypothetical protein
MPVHDWRKVETRLPFLTSRTSGETCSRGNSLRFESEFSDPTARTCPMKAVAGPKVFIRTARISSRPRMCVLTHDFAGLSPYEFSHFNP